MLLNKQKKSHVAKGNRVLITINVLGSAGPLRFVVYEEELVGSVMDMALKLYAREGRLPVLGSNISEFMLYCPAAGTEALSPLGTIGAHGGRSFMLFKKPQDEKKGAAPPAATISNKKGSGSWKAWINKSLKVASH